MNTGNNVYLTKSSVRLLEGEGTEGMTEEQAFISRQERTCTGIWSELVPDFTENAQLRGTCEHRWVLLCSSISFGPTGKWRRKNSGGWRCLYVISSSVSTTLLSARKTSRKEAMHALIIINCISVELSWSHTFLGHNWDIAKNEPNRYFVSALNIPSVQYLILQQLSESNRVINGPLNNWPYFLLFLTFLREIRWL